jgi:hypothetical protein
VSTEWRGVVVIAAQAVVSRAPKSLSVGRLDHALRVRRVVLQQAGVSTAGRMNQPFNPDLKSSKRTRWI